MAAELKTILKEAFGESSSESDIETEIFNSSNEISKSQSIFGDNQTWEPIAKINGLWICRDFLSADQQFSLLTSMEKEGYFAECSHNQAMRFGDLPDWAVELSSLIRQSVLFIGYFSESKYQPNDVYTRKNDVFPAELLWREPLFNQLIANKYESGEGICAHVDLMRFEDGIAIISLESSCVMHFSSVQAESGLSEEVNKDNVLEKIPVLLNPGSLILMSGEARYLWKHEINRRPGFQIWEGQDIDQKRRTSVTLRRLCVTE